MMRVDIAVFSYVNDLHLKPKRTKKKPKKQKTHKPKIYGTRQQS